MSKVSGKATAEELLAKAQQPMKDAIRLHSFYGGKIETALKCRVKDWNDFAIWYTPGVSAPCLEIEADPKKAYEYTNKWNRIAVVSDGTRVLGMGDIGPKGALPVMEGKCLLFKYLGGVDAVPITLDTKDPEEIIRTVLLLQPAFGGINLEDISHPKCFEILDRLRAEAEICIFHDDQQGTATVILAALINALKVVGKKMNEVKIAFVGSGAACVATARLLFAAGVRPELTLMVDSKGILHRDRKDISGRKDEFKHKWHLCQITNAKGRRGAAAEALEGADVCIAMSKSEPGTIKPEWVRKMAKDSILFPLANPLPEIWPWVAREAGARIIATGRSDFPNQVNNSNGFPAIFRGALDVRAKTITDEMCLAAAGSMAKRAEESGLDDESITPNMNDMEMFCREAVAVGMKAQEQGVALLKMDAATAYKKAKTIIERAQNMTQSMMREGFIPKAD